MGEWHSPLVPPTSWSWAILLPHLNIHDLSLPHTAAPGVEVVAISNDTSLLEGETALLACVGYSKDDVEVTWSRNGATVMNSSLVSTYQEETVEGGRVFRHSFLQLCSVKVTDSGAYTCVITNGQTSDNSSVQLTISGQSLKIASNVTTIVPPMILVLLKMYTTSMIPDNLALGIWLYIS